ncbi:MAG TPA: bifunctional hydroxymethylpyrimidine kinase/phosphomethylpyrimidine kinase [Solimonas sp.]|nr:bifunctional hydroxymethylpyrimidine kinase/phosphomethylpyrimidine kinase [Solimonas sp.]
MQAPEKPLVLCCSGHDPGGGAGIHADIETVAALGGHALSVITASTVQDTSDVRRVAAVAPILVGAQLEALLADCRIKAIKIGLLGDAEQIPHILAAIDATGVPVVLDPVLRAGGGSGLASARTIAAMQSQLFARTTVLTPNAAEARRLAPGSSSLEDCAGSLLEQGCANVLVTGGDEPGDPVVNTWFAPGQAPVSYAWPRLAGPFHGAGCTLAAAIAALLAAGRGLAEALEGAQRYTHGTLQHSFRTGQGRRIPGRHF